MWTFRWEVLCLTPSNGKINRGQESGIILPLEFLWKDCVLITKYNPLSEHVSIAHLNQSRTGSDWKIKHVFCTLSDGSHYDMCCFVAVCQRSANTTGQYLCPGTRNFPMFRENRKTRPFFNSSHFLFSQGAKIADTWPSFCHDQAGRLGFGHPLSLCRPAFGQGATRMTRLAKFHRRKSYLNILRA